MNTESPLPSKDGKKIYFIGARRRGEVMRYDLKTQNLTPFMPGFSANELSFTKDGKGMAYVSYPEGILWQSRTDGSDKHQLTFPPMEAGLPRVSPDESQIAFQGGLPAEPSQIFVISAWGGTPEKVTSGNLPSGDVTWSSDGCSIAYVEGEWGSRTQLKILNLKTREVASVPGSEGIWSPRWSPDGRYLLATPMDASKIVLYDFSSRTWQELAQVKAANSPNWTPDSQCVYFNAAGGKQNLEYRVCLTDRKVEQIADLAQAGRLVPYSGIGLAPDGSILALRDISTEEIYALDVKFP